jgi:uncharacterized repeat protein (TIGR01451 family)
MIYKKHIRTLMITLLGTLAFTAARADVLVDDFENVSDWSNLTLETSLVHEGAGAGRWANQTTRTYTNKVFSTPINASSANFAQFWLYSEVANNALIEMVFQSENSATTGGDYYRYTIRVDWTGWRYFNVPLNEFIVARTPIGWNQINSVALHADGWGHTPLADTVLILDDMSFVTSVIKEVNKTAAFVGADYIYTFTVDLEDRFGVDQTLSLALQPETGYPFSAEIVTPAVFLPANGTAQAQVRVTVPASQISSATLLDLHTTQLQFLAGAQPLDAVDLEARVPPLHREHPRSLLDSADFTRINQWASTESWAANARDSIIANADGWPASYNSKYNLATWELPPEGGQWTGWYACPQHGVTLTYDKLKNAHIDTINSHEYYGYPYDQVVYGWRHSELAGYARDLGLAYRLTGEVSYAQSAAEILLAYAESYLLYPVHDIYGKTVTSGNRGRVTAQVLDEAVWLIPIAWAYDLIADAPSVLTETQRGHIESNLLRAAREIIDWSGAPNQQSWNNAAIGAVGFALEDSDYIAEAIRGVSGFESQMQHYIDSDGVWKEGSWAYHFYALDPLIMLAEAATRGSYDLYTNNSPLRNMFEAPLDFAMPNWEMPMFGDSYGSISLISFARNFEPANNRYGPAAYNLPLAQSTRGRDGLFWGELTVPSVTADSLGSVLFAESGYAVLRASQDSDISYVAMRYGAFGGHDHPDRLGFISYARGGVMGVDPGTISYGTVLYNEWYKQTIAHNTVVSDGVSQSKVNGSTGTLQRFVAMPALSMVAADGGPLYTDMNLQRTLVQGSDYLLDRFRVRATDGASHNVDWIYHNYGTLTTPLSTKYYAGLPTSNGYQHMTDVAAAATGGDWQASFTVTGTAARALHLRMLGETGTTVVTGNGPGPGPKATTTVPFTMARRSSSDTVFVSLLEPTSGASNITSFGRISTDAADTDEALAVEVVATGYRDQLLALSAGDGSVTRTFGDSSCDGTLCLIRKDIAGNVTRLALANGSHLEQSCTQGNCVNLLQSSEVLTALQVDIDSTVNQVNIQSDAAITGELWIYYPGANSATQLTVNGVTATGIQLGGYLTLNVPAADLALSVIGDAGPVLLNDIITYAMTVTNNGSSSASAVTLTSTLGEGASLVSATASQGSCSTTSPVTCDLGNLAPGASITVTLMATAASAGSVTTNALVSAAENDPDTANNNASTTTSVVSGADLIPVALSVSRSGGNLLINDRVKNQGITAAGTFAVGYYISSDEIYQADSDLFLCSRTVAALAAGASDPATGTIRTTCAIPPLPYGTYYLVTVADSGNSVIESNETNNSRARANLNLGPDLAPQAVTVSKSGSTLTLKDRVKNQGSAPADEFTISFYLSSDTSYQDSSDYFICSRSVNSLGVGIQNPTSGTTTTACSIPASAPAGTYYVIVIDDAANSVMESNENNNTRATIGTIMK